MTSPIDPYSRIIWSADVWHMGNLVRALASMSRKPIVKIDRPFFERRENGAWAVFETLATMEDVVVFDDAKISGVGRELYDSAVNHTISPQPWMLNCMATSISNGIYIQTLDDQGRKQELDSLKQFADVCNASGVAPCAVTVLTSKSEEIIWDEYNQRDGVRQVEWYAEWLVKFGFTHLVCSPLEAKAVRRHSDFSGLTLVTPGIRPAGAAVTHQSRFTTPAQAFENGADYIVIGSPITNGPGTIAENLDAIAAEVQAVLN